MFVEVDKRVRIEDLLRGAIVQSGNDACIVLAEGLSGSEKAFADAMNRKARELGLADSHFLNASGWPADGHVMSPRDVAGLARRIIEDFPEYYPWFAEKSFRYNGIRQGNRNPLLYRDTGADGLKTGYTRASDYALAASAIREGRRIVMVLAGLSSARQRSREARRLLDWAYEAFANYTLFACGAAVAHAEVWLGEEDTVPLVAKGDIGITLPRTSRRGLVVKALTAAMEGSAACRGAAVGVWPTEEVSGGWMTAAWSGAFTAEAVLTAHFFGAGDAGEIGSFGTASGRSSAGWRVTLSLAMLSAVRGGLRGLNRGHGRFQHKRHGQLAGLVPRQRRGGDQRAVEPRHRPVPPPLPRRPSRRRVRGRAAALAVRIRIRKLF